MDNGEFGDSLVKMLAWRRKQLPELGTPQGVELMRRLLKHAGRPQPIGTIYSASKLSTPTMRKTVKAFVQRGFARIEPDPDDAQRSLARGMDGTRSPCLALIRRKGTSAAETATMATKARRSAENAETMGIPLRARARGLWDRCM